MDLRCAQGRVPAQRDLVAKAKLHFKAARTESKNKKKQNQSCPSRIRPGKKTGAFKPG